MIQVACSTRCFPLETPARALSRVAWAGFRAAEVALPPGEDPPTEAVAERLEAEELSLVCVDAGVIATDSPESALESVAHIGRCAVAARKLGASRVLFRAGASGSEEHLLYGLSRLLVALRDLPVTLCLCAEPGSVVPSAASVAELARALDKGAGGLLPPSAWLRLALDPAALAIAGADPEAALEAALAPDARARLGHVTLSDCDAGKRVAPGEGDLDWGSLSSLLRSGRYAGPVTVRLDDEDPLFAEIAAKEAAGVAHALFPDAIILPGGER